MDVHGGTGDGSVCYEDQGRCPGPGKTDLERTGASPPSASLTQAGLALLLESTGLTHTQPPPGTTYSYREEEKRSGTEEN